MAITYAKFFEPVVLGIAVSTLLTVSGPASTLLRGCRARLTNTTASPVSITMYAVPNAGTPGADNAFVYGRVIGANDYLDVDVPILKVGDSLQGVAGTAASITAQAISGAYFA